MCKHLSAMLSGSSSRFSKRNPNAASPSRHPHILPILSYSHSHSRSRNSRDSEEWLMVALYIWYSKESCVPQEKRAGHFQWTIRKVKSYFKTWTLSQSLMCTSGCVALNPPVQWQWTPSSILLPNLFLDRSSGTFHRLVVFLWELFRGKLSPQRHMLIVFKCRDFHTSMG